ncbi:hypothetical protein NL676_029200 [Syzygium grande]|nr:hypothetical protein NL676_029200 [Syzygium grande]
MTRWQDRSGHARTSGFVGVLLNGNKKNLYWINETLAIWCAATSLAKTSTKLDAGLLLCDSVRLVTARATGGDLKQQ